MILNYSYSQKRSLALPQRMGVFRTMSKKKINITKFLTLLRCARTAAESFECYSPATRRSICHRKRKQNSWYQNVACITGYSSTATRWRSLATSFASTLKSSAPAVTGNAGQHIWRKIAGEENWFSKYMFWSA